MRATSIIYKRELGAYLKQPLGYLIAAIGLFIAGAAFYTEALGPRHAQRLSGEVLADFFKFSGFLTMTLAVLLSMRLVAQERSSGTMVLLNTSPVRDVEIVLGKYFAALTFLAGIIALTVYMPILVMVNGKISLGHVLVGYSGMLLLGAACLAIGMFATSLTNEQLVAGAVGGVIVFAIYIVYFLAREITGPLRDVFENVSIYWSHYRPFMHGVLHLKHVVYYLAVVYFFLLLATKTLEARRWR